MPAPTAAQIQGFLETALKTEFVNREVVDGQLVEKTGELPPNMVKLVRALSVGLANQWSVWQATQGIAGVTVGVGSVPGPAALP